MNREQRRAQARRDRRVCGYIDPEPVNLAAGVLRSCCSQCGGRVTWLDVEEAWQDPELSQLMREAVGFLGEPPASVWRCTRSVCGETGFFGSLHAV